VSISDVVAIVSTCIAGFALVWSWQVGRQTATTTREANDLARQQLVLQDRLAKIEQSREHAQLIQALQAMLRCSLERTDRGGWRLVVTNTGRGTAHNVAITIDDKPVLEHPAVPQGQDEATVIGPNSEISYIMALHMSCHPPFKLAATWDDESGVQGRYATTLTF
jgi:hypothetical protein